MSKHDHPEPKPPCAHDALKFCAKCDAVECANCGAEWKKPGLQVCFREHADESQPYRARIWPSQPYIAPAPQWPTAPILPGGTWCQSGGVLGGSGGLLQGGHAQHIQGLHAADGGLPVRTSGFGSLHPNEDNS